MKQSNLFKVEIFAKAQKEIDELAGKFQSLPNIIQNLMCELSQRPQLGDRMSGMGGDLYQINQPSPDSSEGTSSGFRVVTRINQDSRTVAIIKVEKKQSIAEKRDYQQYRKEILRRIK